MHPLPVATGQASYDDARIAWRQSLRRQHNLGQDKSPDAVHQLRGLLVQARHQCDRDKAEICSLRHRLGMMEDTVVNMRAFINHETAMKIGQGVSSAAQEDPTVPNTNKRRRIEMGQSDCEEERGLFRLDAIEAVQDRINMKLAQSPSHRRGTPAPIVFIRPDNTCHSALQPYLNGCLNFIQSPDISSTTIWARELKINAAGSLSPVNAELRQRIRVHVDKSNILSSGPACPVLFGDIQYFDHAINVFKILPENQAQYFGAYYFIQDTSFDSQHLAMVGTASSPSTTARSHYRTGFVGCEQTLFDMIMLYEDFAGRNL